MCLPILIFAVIGTLVAGPFGLIAGIMIGGFIGVGRSNRRRA